MSYVGIPLSEGSLYNFNQTAYDKLETFEVIAKETLIAAPILHVDETGINIDGDRHWLHCATNASWTDFFAHKIKEAQKQRNQQEYSPPFAVCFAMTTGNPITPI